MGVDDRPDDVLASALAGEPEAVAQLYRDLFPRLLRFLYALDPAEAEDLASDTWIDLVTALPRFRGDARGVRALAFTIARRRAIDLRRRRVRSTPVPPGDETLTSGPAGDVEEESLFRLETREAIARIATLPRDQAEVVLLRVLGDLSVEQVARIVGKRPGAVRALQHRGLRRLARTFSREAVTR